MIRWMTWINFLGVIAVSLLCGRQWSQDARVRFYVVQLNSAKRSLDTKLAEQISVAASQQHDLDTLRGLLTTSDTDLAAEKQKCAAATADRDRLDVELERQRAALNQWKSAVADRDRSLKDSSMQLQALASARDDAVRRYNELVAKFNQQRSEPSGNK